MAQWLPAASQHEKWEYTFFDFEFPTNYFHLRPPLFDPLPGTMVEAETYGIQQAEGRRRTAHSSSTATPIDRAVPAMTRIAAAMSVVFRSGSLRRATARS